MKPDLIYEFAGHTLDLGHGRLQHNNQDVAIRPKSLALQVYLVGNPGRIIDKEELIGAIWPNTIVSDDSLSQCLKDVRSALGAHAEGLIRTVPRRGYIVDEGNVQCRSELPALRSSKPSIAVFSFRPQAQDREHLWFADGLGEDIAAALTRSRQLELLPEEWRALQLSRTGSMEAYTYYRHGWQLARHWTKAYLLLARRMFARAVEIDTNFARAHCAIAICDCFLLEWFASDETPESILAIADRALALDPHLAQSHVARGLAFQRSGRAEEAQASYARALVIDPACFEARLFAAFLAWMQGRRDIAREQFAEAAQLHRDDYLAPYFVLAVIDKSSPEKARWAQLAFELAERAAVFQPENPALLSRGAIALTHLGKMEQAISWTRRALTLDPDDPITNYNAASVYSVSGDQETALRFLEVYIRQSSQDMVGLVSNDEDLAGVREHPGFRELLAGNWSH